MSDHSPSRLSGTPQAEVAVDYILKYLDLIGVESTLSEIEMFVSYPESAELVVTHPFRRSIAAIPRAHIRSTDDQGVIGRITYAGYGTPQELRDACVRGAIVLVDLSGISTAGGQQFAITRHEQSRFAQDAGALGLVQISFGENIQFGNVKDSLGNPVRAISGQLPRIPVVSISKHDGDFLKSESKQENLIGLVRAKSWQGWKKTRQVVATIRSDINPNQFVLVGAHCDSWVGPCATDNASGVSLLLELSRVLQNNRDRLKRSVKLAWWQGHENASYAGSCWYVETEWSQLGKGCLVYYNCDSPGLKNTDFYRSYVSTELQDFHLQILQQLGIDQIVSQRPPKMADWFPFYTARGLPVIYDRYDFASQEDWWWWHTDQDTMERFDVEKAKEQLRVYFLSIWRMIDSEVIPYNILRVATQFNERVHMLQEKYRSLFDIGEIVALSDDLVLNCEKLRTLETKSVSKVPSEERKLFQERLNELYIAFTRQINNLLYSKSQPYEYDLQGVYGEGMNSLIPNLSPLVFLPSLDRNDPTYDMIVTEVRRAKNRILDVLSGVQLEITRFLNFEKN